jgi:hypothetical protein
VDKSPKVALTAPEKAPSIVYFTDQYLIELFKECARSATKKTNDADRND